MGTLTGGACLPTVPPQLLPGSWGLALLVSAAWPSASALSPSAPRPVAELHPTAGDVSCCVPCCPALCQGSVPRGPQPEVSPGKCCGPSREESSQEVPRSGPRDLQGTVGPRPGPSLGILAQEWRLSSTTPSHHDGPPSPEAQSKAAAHLGWEPPELRAEQTFPLYKLIASGISLQQREANTCVCVISPTAAYTAFSSSILQVTDTVLFCRLGLSQTVLRRTHG